MTEGDKVRCITPSIDREIGESAVGVVDGFARLSSYHPREVMVRFSDGAADWFWMRDLEIVT